MSAHGLCPSMTGKIKRLEIRKIVLSLFPHDFCSVAGNMGMHEDLDVFISKL